MAHPAIAALETEALRTGLPEFRVGDTIRVHYRIVEGEKERVQVYQGVVIKRHRAGARSTFTSRKVSFSVGVERTFLLHSPRIDKIEVVSRGIVRRARLYYLRDLQGKAARLRDEKDKLETRGLRPLRGRISRRDYAERCGLRVSISPNAVGRAYAPPRHGARARRDQPIVARFST